MKKHVTNGYVTNEDVVSGPLLCPRFLANMHGHNPLFYWGNRCSPLTIITKLKPTEFELQSARKLNPASSFSTFLICSKASDQSS